MISSDIQKQLDTIKRNESEYWPQTSVRNQLAEKDFIMVVGPSAIGKSTLMNKVAELDDEFTRVRNMTSRPPRANDETGHYEYIEHTDTGIKQVLDLIDAKELVQYVVHPTTGFIYATRPTSYPGKYNMLDTQAKVVSSLSILPFHKVHIVCVITDPKAWQAWFLERNKKETDDYTTRIDEAIHSLESMTARPAESILWVYNQPDNLTATASDFITLIKGSRTNNTQLREQAITMLYLAYQMKE